MRNMTKRRRYMLSSEKVPRIPEEYQEVAWLRGTGTQRLTLPFGIGLTSDNHFYGIKGDIELLDGSGYSKLTMEAMEGLGSQPQYNSYWNFIAQYGDFDIRYHPSRGRQLPDLVFSADDELSYHFEVNRNSMIINNSTMNNPSYPLPCYINGLVLGARMGTNDIYIIENSNTLIKSIKSTYDDNLVYELIPCYRVDDNKAGLFYWIDYAQGTSGFITNSTSGSDFLVGPNV